MAEVDIKYRGNSIATMNASGSKTLGTQNKYCDSDIVVEYTQPAQAVIESNKNATPSETAQEITPSSGYDAMAKVTVGAVSSSYVGTAIPRKASANLSASGATVTAPAGYYENNATKTIDSATWKSASTVGVVPAISVDANGLITANAAGWTSCKPLSASGYADADTSANLQLAGTKTHQLTTQAATTYHPSTTDQTIASGKYLTGAQTIKAVTTTNLTAANIKSGVVVEVGDSADSDCVTSVTGTYAGGGGSSWTLLASTTLTVKTTSTSAASAGTVSAGSAAFTKGKIIYVRIRDKAGPRTGYFYGSDTFFINYYAAINNNSTYTYAARSGFCVNSSGNWTSASSSYGVYGHSIATDGTVTIRRRYNSSYGTIDGTFLVQVYALDYPDGKSPFDTGIIS